MKMMRSVTALVATTMLATAVTPAMADGYRGGYGNRGWGDYRHRDRGVSGGDILAGAAVIGIIAAIAIAASKSKNNNSGDINSESRAADACSSRVEQQFGNGARVRNIDDVYRTRDGYDVRGTIETRDWRDNNDNARRFTCAVRYGRIADVRIDNGYAYNGADGGEYRGY